MSESWMTYQKYSIDLYKVKVTLRLDKKNGKKIATHKLASSSWDTATFSDNKPNIRGKHKVYMIFHTDNSLVPASESASAKTTIWFFGFKKAHIIGKPAKEKITTLEPGYYGTGSCMIKWKVLTENCSGYQYDFCENSSFMKGTYYRQTAKDPNTVGGGVTKLTVGKKYYVRVRAYHKANNQTRYGAWSKKRSFKAK